MQKSVAGVLFTKEKKGFFLGLVTYFGGGRGWQRVFYHADCLTSIDLKIPDWFKFYSWQRLKLQLQLVIKFCFCDMA